MYKKLITLLLVLVTITPCIAQDAPWKLKVDKEGIKIYTRAIPNSKLNAIKAEFTLNTRPSQLVYIILDIANSGEWVYHSKSATVIKQVSPAELYYYSEVSVPFPFQNRDYISHISVSQNPQTKIITVDAPCVPGLNMVPAKPGIVRILNSTGKWTIGPMMNNTTKVEYELAVDPAGAIPAWLINLFATEGPYKTCERLKLQVQKPAYKNVKLPYIVD